MTLFVSRKVCVTFGLWASMLFSSLYPHCLVMCWKTFDLHISEEKDERKVKDTTARHTMCICCASLLVPTLTHTIHYVRYTYIYLHLLVLNGKTIINDCKYPETMDPMSWWCNPYRAFNPLQSISCFTSKPPTLCRIMACHGAAATDVTDAGGVFGVLGRGWSGRDSLWVSHPVTQQIGGLHSSQAKLIQDIGAWYLFAWSLKKSMDQKFETAFLVDGLKQRLGEVFSSFVDGWGIGELVSLQRVWRLSRKLTCFWRPGIPKQTSGNLPKI